jgi:hypothetical protein
MRQLSTFFLCLFICIWVLFACGSPTSTPTPSVTPKPTLDAEQQTANAEQQTATTSYLLDIEPLYVSATAFILHATEVAFAHTATTDYLLDTNPLYVSATAFILSATATDDVAQTATMQYLLDIGPQYATETAAVQRYFAKIAVYDTAMAPLTNTSPTQTPVLLPSPLPDSHPTATIAASPTFAPDDLFASATAFLQYATETEVYRLTHSPTPTATPGPEDLTQTAFWDSVKLTSTVTIRNNMGTTEARNQAATAFMEGVTETAAALLTASPTPAPPTATFAPETATVAARRVDTLFQRETGTAQAMTATEAARPTWTPSPTQTPSLTRAPTETPLPETATALFFEMPTVEYLLTNCPLCVSATAFVRSGKQTQAALPTRTPVPTRTPSLTWTPTATPAPQTATAIAIDQLTHPAPTVDATIQYLLDTEPLYASATAFILQVTQAACRQYPTGPSTPQSLPTATEIATLSPQAKADLHARWIADLETAVGFSHPVFDEVVDKVIQWVKYTPGFFDYAPDFPAEVEPFTYDDTGYVAVIVPETLSIIWGTRFLLFQLDDNTPTLIYDLELGSNGQRYVGELMSFDSDLYTYTPQEDASTFADRNGNGYPELLIHTASSIGSSGCIYGPEVLLEFQPDGSIVDIAPPSWDNMGLVDLDGDGIMEIVLDETVSNPFWGGKCRSPLTRWYAWDGTAYMDITATLTAYFQLRIDAYWESIADREGCLIPDDRMVQLLLDYEAIGQLDVGWARLQPRLHWELCPPYEPMRPDSPNRQNMESFLRWVEDHLEASRKRE